MNDYFVRSNSVSDLRGIFGQIAADTRLMLIGELVEATSPSTVGQSFSVSHKIGRTPVLAIGVSNTGQNISITDAEYRLWRTDSIVVHSQTADTKYRILIVG